MTYVCFWRRGSRINLFTCMWPTWTCLIFSILSPWSCRIMGVLMVPTDRTQIWNQFHEHFTIKFIAFKINVVLTLWSTDNNENSRLYHLLYMFPRPMFELCWTLLCSHAIQQTLAEDERTFTAYERFSYAYKGVPIIFRFSFA